MATYPNTGEFDLELNSSGGGWCGTFAGLIRYAAADILSDRESYGPVEVTYPVRDGAEPTALVGMLTDSDSNTLFIDTSPYGVGTMHSIDIDAVVRFRA